jgi:ribosome-associated toxin RatA of RatAB toxin-antitoxin module
MKNKLSLLVMILSLGAMHSFGQTEWTLRKDKDGIKVYSASIPDSKIQAIKVTASYKTTPEQITAVIMNVNTATQWVAHLKTSTMLKRVSANELYYYAEVKLPWPVQNRDFVAHLVAHEDRLLNATIIEGPAVSGYVPEKKGLIRINNSTGKWTITPAPQGEVNVEYCLHVDPAGSIPSWLINLFSTEAPFEIFKNLGQHLEKITANNDIASVGQVSTK